MQARKEEMKQRISQELAVANAQTLINVSRLCGSGCCMRCCRDGEPEYGQAIEGIDERDVRKSRHSESSETFRP